MSTVRKVLGQLALVVAGSLATVLLLGGGPAGAFSVPNNSVNSAKIVNNTVSSADIKNGTVAPGDLSTTARARWAKVSGGNTGTLIRGRGVGLVVAHHRRQLPGHVCPASHRLWVDGDAQRRRRQLGQRGHDRRRAQLRR